MKLSSEILCSISGIRNLIYFFFHFSTNTYASPVTNSRHFCKEITYIWVFFLPKNMANYEAFDIDNFIKNNPLFSGE